RAAPAHSYMYGIARGAGRFVAVGATTPYAPNNNRMVVNVSADGDAWTHQELSESGIPRAVAFGNGQFVAVGEGFPSLLITSPDAVTWTLRPTPAPAPVLRDVVFANGRFVAVGNGGRILTSTDGLAWEDV